MTSGIVYIAIGDKYIKAANQKKQDYSRYGIPITIITISNNQYNNMQLSRYAKVKLFDLSPYDKTLYLDVDTNILSNDFTLYFDLLDKFDLVITPSTRQDYWHIQNKEKSELFTCLGYQPLQLQAGVFSFNKSKEVARLFDIWYNIWKQYEDKDQCSLAYAMSVNPVKYWLLSSQFNNGNVISHRFGNI